MGLEVLIHLVPLATGLQVAQAALNTVLSANPIGLVVAAAASSYREGDTNITQNIYSKAHTAADLLREARWESDRAKAQNR